MSVKIFRRGSARCIGLLSAFFTILLCLYYISMGQSSTKDYASKRLIDSLHHNNNNHHHHNNNNNNVNNNNNMKNDNDDFNHSFKSIFDKSSIDEIEEVLSPDAARLNLINLKNLKGVKDFLSRHKTDWDKCSVIGKTKTDITTQEEFAKFDFQPEWMKTKEYWDKSFETRYENLRKDTTRPPLKVILVPHSHNDPGWLKTFTNYFQSDTRQILNFIITKMHEYTDMTFIWSEISFLQLWWDQAHPTKQRALKQLVDQGRFEITTGGWVMTDEANAHVYAMVDQLIEGHQWVKTNLNYTPTTGWSIDPFGHGSTVPYLLSASGFKGAIIQRIHYAWKQWLAERQQGDFMWHPYWSTAEHEDKPFDSSSTIKSVGPILTHNMPYDIYSIKHSCGPHPFICLNFDFRKIPGEYTEYSIKAQFITDDNIQAKADLLIEQYARTASLYPHNVALVPIGDDFRYNKEREVEQQYTNYKKLIDYINKNHDRYKTEIHFGLPRDYFEAIQKRTNKFPSLKGDFYVYSDIFTEGRPAYWSGYFTTRPMYKILSRDLEHNLRCLEILFTIAFNHARQHKNSNALRVFEKNYEKLIAARRNLGLFQHHDAITGTSKANVMRDYGMRLFESIQDTVKLQESTIELLIQEEQTNVHGFVLSELERESFNKLPRKSPILVGGVNKTYDFVVYNSLAQQRFEVITIRTPVSNVEIHDLMGNLMEIQINPVWNISDGLDSLGVHSTNQNRIRVSDKQFEVLFVANLKALSLTTFTIVTIPSSSSSAKQPIVGKSPRMATLYCNDCKDEQNQHFDVRNKQPGDIQLENNKMRLLFDEQSGFLKTITKKDHGKPIQCAIKFAAYRSAQFHSGAYLFKTDPEHHEAEKDVFEQYLSDVKILITSGPIASDVTVIYGPFLAHTVRLYNSKTSLDQGIYIENDIDFEPPPKNRETELFMRLVTDIENAGDLPEFYSDLNSFQFEKRVKVPSIGVEGNYFPITSAAFIQDEKWRLSLITTHAQGAASLEPGYLEVMMDRRTLYDDYRGMGEGVVDSRLTRHKYWLMVEQFNGGADSTTNAGSNSDYQLPSLLTNQLINSHNYPANIYFIEKSDESINLKLIRNVNLIEYRFPCDLQLMTLRTLTEPDLPLFPSSNALMVVHRQGYSCRYGDGGMNVHGEPPPSCTEDSYLIYSRDLNLFNELKVKSMTATSLTGLEQFESITSFDKIFVKRMEIRTFNISFAGT